MASYWEVPHFPLQHNRHTVWSLTAGWSSKDFKLCLCSTWWWLFQMLPSSRGMGLAWLGDWWLLPGWSFSPRWYGWLCLMTLTIFKHHLLSVLGVIRTITPCWSLWSWLDVSMVFCCVYQSTRTRYLEVLNFLAATLPILFFDATKMCVEAWLKMRPQVLLTGSVHNYGCVKIHKALICSTFIYTCSNTYLWKNF